MGYLPLTADSCEEDAAAGEWMWAAVSRRPRPFQPCYPDAEVEGACRKIRKLRGTGELWALNRFLDHLLERAEARSDGYAESWRR